MVAGSFDAPFDSATVAVVVASLPVDSFSVVASIIVDLSFSVAFGDEEASLVEVHGKVQGHLRRCLSENHCDEQHDQEESPHVSKVELQSNRKIIRINTNLLCISRCYYQQSKSESEYNITTTMEEVQVFQSQEDPHWVNKSRTLIVSSRGMTANQRAMMLALFALMPHSKKDCKLEKEDVKGQIEELCMQFKTRYFLYFEVKKKIRFSMWIGRYPEGPSVKIELEDMVGLKDVRFQGNSVKGARQILSFDGGFASGPEGLLKQLLIGAFNIPKNHPKSTGVVDHVLNFTSEGGKVGFRNYQIFRENVNKDKEKLDLYEIGPRFIMSVNCILDGVIGGEVLYRSPVIKKTLKKSKADKRKQLRHGQVKPRDIFGEEV